MRLLQGRRRGTRSGNRTGMCRLGVPCLPCRGSGGKGWGGKVWRAEYTDQSFYLKTCDAGNAREDTGLAVEKSANLGAWCLLYIAVESVSGNSPLSTCTMQCNTGSLHYSARITLDPREGHHTVILTRMVSSPPPLTLVEPMTNHFGPTLVLLFPSSRRLGYIALHT